MLGGHWDISRKNHSIHVYTTLSPHWDTTAECVSWVHHLQVKRPTEQSVSGGPTKKEKTSWQLPHWKAAVAMLTKGSIYNVFWKTSVSVDSILTTFSLKLSIKYFQWKMPGLWYIYFFFVLLKSIHAVIHFSSKQWKKRQRVQMYYSNKQITPVSWSSKTPAVGQRGKDVYSIYIYTVFIFLEISFLNA